MFTRSVEVLIRAREAKEKLLRLSSERTHFNPLSFDFTVFTTTFPLSGEGFKLSAVFTSHFQFWNNIFWKKSIQGVRKKERTLSEFQFSRLAFLRQRLDKIPTRIVSHMGPLFLLTFPLIAAHDIVYYSLFSHDKTSLWRLNYCKVFAILFILFPNWKIMEPETFFRASRTHNSHSYIARWWYTILKPSFNVSSTNSFYSSHSNFHSTQKKTKDENENLYFLRIQWVFKFHRQRLYGFLVGRNLWCFFFSVHHLVGDDEAGG